ncbi:hypothetical protein LCGC14_2103260 [marine sediment metagenome]|uniref:Uncharacterized protein n=1 Tax=marine sediment metagenome TaxID=412755 RepID=A0A0F9EWF7_9ZZZZ
MTEQEKRVATQRLGVLTVFRERLIELETDATLVYPKGHERNAGAQKDLDDLSIIVDRLDADPHVIELQVIAAEADLAAATAAVETATAKLRALRS